MNTTLWIIVAIILADFITERWLDYLNTKQSQQPLPSELKSVYDASSYRKQQNYYQESQRLELLSSSWSLILILVMLLSGGFGWFNHIIENHVQSPIWTTLLFFGGLMLASDILSIPFSFYSTFHIEEKYGFNKTTPFTFFTDKLKGWLLTAIIGGILLGIIITIFQNFPHLFWVAAWLIISLFSIFISMFYSSLIVPLFNKQTPLEDGELKTAIEAFAQKTGFTLDNIFVIDGSKRSTKANAYFTGLGKQKRIVLYDTLIKDLSTEEIVAVLAHEIGHYKKRHIIRSLISGIVQMGIVLFIFSLCVNSPVLSLALGADHPSFQLGLIAFSLLYTPVSFVTSLIFNRISRKNEYEADRFASDHGLGDSLISGLKKLSTNSLSNLTPHPTYVKVYFSHPTLLQRIRAIKASQTQLTNK